MSLNALIQELHLAKSKDLILAVHEFSNTGNLGNYIAVVFPERISLDKVEDVKKYIQNRYNITKIMVSTSHNRTLYIQI